MTTQATKLTKQEEAEADYFDKMDNEGGLFGALEYGLRAKDYALSKADKTQLTAIEKEFEVLKKRADKILDRFQASSDKRADAQWED